jgi:DNA-binding FadR family transcriptional regulator
MFSNKLSSELLNYLARNPNGDEGRKRLPALNVLSRELGINIARLREQLEVARALGLVEVKPRTGIRRLPYTFLPAVQQSLFYAINLDRDYFKSYSDLRKHIEMAYWHEAVVKLTTQDHQHLRDLIDRAWMKLHGDPIQIPHEEHRELHLSIYKKLGNPFVIGLLEAYWDAYEAVGLNVYADYDYLQQVWEYHERMVEAICNGDVESGFQSLIEHTNLINKRPSSFPKHQKDNSPEDERGSQKRK